MMHFGLTRLFGRFVISKSYVWKPQQMRGNNVLRSEAGMSEGPEILRVRRVFGNPVDHIVCMKVGMSEDPEEGD